MRLVDRIIDLKEDFGRNFDYLFLEDGDKEKYGYETDEEVVIDNACPHHFEFLNVNHIGLDKCGSSVTCEECWDREYVEE